MTTSTEAATDPRLAVIYDRASTERQRDNYARADAARLSELAERRDMRWELRQEIKSGESLTNRPVMKQLLEDIESGKVGPARIYFNVSEESDQARPTVRPASTGQKTKR